jgi:hypothetical protein
VSPEHEKTAALAGRSICYVLSLSRYEARAILIMNPSPHGLHFIYYIYIQNKHIKTEADNMMINFPGKQKISSPRYLHSEEAR